MAENQKVTVIPTHLGDVVDSCCWGCQQQSAGSSSQHQSLAISGQVARAALLTADAAFDGAWAPIKPPGDLRLAQLARDRQSKIALKAAKEVQKNAEKKATEKAKKEAKAKAKQDRDWARLRDQLMRKVRKKPARGACRGTAASGFDPSEWS